MTKITGMLEGNITIYELTKILKAVVENFEKLEIGMMKRIDDNVQCEINDFGTIIVKLKEFIDNINKTIIDTETETIEKYENLYLKLYNKREELDKKLKDLHHFEILDINVPYALKNVIEIAKQCEDMDDKTWERLIELSKAMKENNVK